MYLSDKDIKSKLAEMDVECESSDNPFQPDIQIQPMSIDLRLSNVFWEPLAVKSIDLRKSKLLEIAPRRYWKKRVLEKGESITIRSGKLLLGRVYEKFTIPVTCGGKIEGRSSFARLGIGIHCTGDCINPGYRGYMTLQLFNYSPNPIKIYPYIPICQLMLVQLSSEPEHKYGHRELQSKYMDDDGGPSYWWRDKRIVSLQKVFQGADISLDIQNRILDKIGAKEIEVVERLEKYISKAKPTELENADNLLDAFIKDESRLCANDRIINGLCYAIFPILASASFGIVFARPIGTLHYIAWCVTLGTLWPFIWALKDTPKQYLQQNDVKT
jgi:deoxycytidine triphosphate deaminase